MDQSSSDLATSTSTPLDSSFPSKGKPVLFVSLAWCHLLIPVFLSTNSPRALQATGLILQREVRLRSLLREGSDGEATAAHSGVQEVFWGGGASGCQHPRPSGKITVANSFRLNTRTLIIQVRHDELGLIPCLSTVSHRWYEGEESHLHVHPWWPGVAQC